MSGELRRSDDFSPALAEAFVAAAETFEREGVIPEVTHIEGQIGYGPFGAYGSYTKIRPAEGEVTRRIDGGVIRGELD